MMIWEQGDVFNMDVVGQFRNDAFGTPTIYYGTFC